MRNSWTRYADLILFMLDLEFQVVNSEDFPKLFPSTQIFWPLYNFFNDTTGEMGVWTGC